MSRRSPARTGSATPRAALDTVIGEAYRWGLPAELRGLEPLPSSFALNPHCAAAEGDGRPADGPGLPAFCDGD